MTSLCTICGTRISWPGRHDNNAVCLDCLPNLQASLDRRTVPDAIALDIATVDQLMAEEYEA